MSTASNSLTVASMTLRPDGTLSRKDIARLVHREAIRELARRDFREVMRCMDAKRTAKVHRAH